MMNSMFIEAIFPEKMLVSVSAIILTMKSKPKEAIRNTVKRSKTIQRLILIHKIPFPLIR